MSENGMHEIKLEVEVTVKVVNPKKERGYVLSSKTEVAVGDDRRGTLDDMLEAIMEMPVTPEMREVEGWPS